MKDYELEWLEEVRELFDKVMPSSMLAKNLLSIFPLLDEEEREEFKKEIDEILNSYLPDYYKSKRPVFPAPPEERFDGEIKVGKIVQGDKVLYDFKLRKEDFTRHFAIYAQSGHAKTTLIYNLIDQFMKHKIPFLFFDLKQDGRAIFKKYENLIIIPWRELRWNPLRNPPGMDIKSWWIFLTEICGHVWGVYHAGINYLLEYLDILYEKFEKDKKFPTFQDLFELMKNSDERTRKRQEYFDVMYNRIRSLLSVLGNVVNVREGIRIEELLNYPVVLELEQLRVDEQNWIIEIFLAFIYCYRMVNAQRGEKLRHVIITDEAHRIWDVNKEYRETTKEMGQPVIVLFPTQFRDFGESLIISSQEPSKIMDSVHANTLVKIVGQLGHGKDISFISEAMNLSEEEKEAINKLQRAEWIVKVSDRYTKPFMIITDKVEISRKVNYKEIVQRMKKFLKLGETKKPVIKSKKVFVSKEAWKLLLDVNAHPFYPSLARRYERLKLSANKGNSAKNELIKKELVKDFKIKLGLRRPSTFLVPTNLGLSFLRENGIDVSKWKRIGKQGFEHNLYCITIAYMLRKLGYEVELEKNLLNRRVDVLASANGLRFAIEVEMEEFDLIHETEVLGTIDFLFILCRDESVYLEKERELKNLKISNTKIYRIEDFLRIAYNEYREIKGKNPFSGNKSISSLFLGNLLNLRGKVRIGEEKD